MPADRDQFYSVHVSNRPTSERGTGWVWSRPFDTPAEAKAELHRFFEAGSATLGFVVVIGPGRREVLPRYTRPRSARRIIAQWDELLDALHERMI